VRRSLLIVKRLCIYVMAGAVLTVGTAWMLAVSPTTRRLLGESAMVHSRTVIGGRTVAIGSVDGWMHRSVTWDFNAADDEQWAASPHWLSEQSIRRLLEKAVLLSQSTDREGRSGSVHEFGFPMPSLGYATFRLWTVRADGPSSELNFVDGIRSPVWTIAGGHALPLRPRGIYFFVAVLLNSLLIFVVAAALGLLRRAWSARIARSVI
jgi:hypothetical protein